MILRELTDEVKIKNSSDVVINPATNEKIDEVKTILNTIHDAVDGLELSVDNIDINTDELETKVQSVRDQLDVLLSTRASEVTVSSIDTAIALMKITLESIETDIDVALSSRASESTLLSVKTNLDDVKTKLDSLLTIDFSTESTLASVLNAIGQESGNNVLQQLKLLGTESTIQDILNAIGQASGTDVINQLQAIFDILENGVIDVNFTVASANNQTVGLTFDQIHGAVNKFEWQEVLEFTVPSGFDLNAVTFNAKSQVANENARVVNKIIHGSFDSPTDIYTDSSEEWTSPKFGSKIYIHVTTQIDNASDDDITITYTNQDGVTGRTALVTIPKSSDVGTRLEAPLQSGDIGILDITNVTHSATGQDGAFEIESVVELFYLTLTESDIQYNSPSAGLGGIVVGEDEKIYLQYQSNSTVNNRRRVSLIATLVEKQT